MDVEYGDIWILDNLLVTQLVSTPHEELPVHPELCVHDMEEAVWVLSCDAVISNFL